MIKIFVDAESRYPGWKDKRLVACVIEYETGKTKDAMGYKSGTYHEAILKMLVNALKYVPEWKGIGIYSQDTFVTGMIGSGTLDMWDAGQYMRKTGEPVKNCELWKEVHGLIEKRQVMETARESEYYNWMMSEMKRRKSRPASVKSMAGGDSGSRIGDSRA